MEREAIKLVKEMYKVEFCEERRIIDAGEFYDPALGDEVLDIAWGYYQEGKYREEAIKEYKEEGGIF